jgi:regulatory protein
MGSTTEKAPAVTLRRAAMNLLARRDHGFRELLDKLSVLYPDFSPEELIKPVIERLREEGLQSDLRFLEAFVSYRSKRGMGPLKIAAELHPRGLSQELVKEALYGSGIDWQELCREALHKKLGSKAGRARLEAAEIQRCIRFLQQRGFPHEDIRKVLAAH